MSKKAGTPGGAAGWFADPSGRHELRYWDGATWTEHVVDAGAQSVDPLVRAASQAPASVTDAHDTRVLPVGDTASVTKRPWWRRIPVWGWIVAAVVLGIPLLLLAFVLAPFVAVAALVVMITAIVAVSKESRTWLRFNSRRTAAVTLAVSAVVVIAASGATAAIYPPSKLRTPTAEASSTPATEPTQAQTPTPTPTRTPTPTAAPSASGAPGTALALLETLPVKGRAPKTGYSRAQFGPAWEDVDHNSCDTRNDILNRDLVATTKRGGCTVLTGILHDPYTTKTIDFVRGQDTSAEVQIDHVVALSDAWQKGAQQLTADQRLRFANDPMNLLAVDGPTNQAKGDGDAATWLPPNRSYRCAYVARQVSVKAAYRLWVTQAEHDAIARVLATCPGQRAVTATTPVPKQKPAPTKPKPPAPPSSVYYANCAAVHAAGKAPLHRGDPGYRSGLDRDGDGVACE